MKDSLLYFFTHLADKIIAISGFTIYKVSTLFGLLFFTEKKKQEKEDYKVIIEKEKL
ncbi:MAG: hypothetical protein HS118_07120 [Bacteroidia bacterium]|nr:hypothetical protein [Bacteroidia bacterium]